jgi:hypothetical protein
MNDYVFKESEIIEPSSPSLSRSSDISLGSGTDT